MYMFADPARPHFNRSLDFANRPISSNDHQAVVDPDGLVRIVGRSWTRKLARHDRHTRRRYDLSLERCDDAPSSSLPSSAPGGPRSRSTRKLDPSLPDAARRTNPRSTPSSSAPVSAWVRLRPRFPVRSLRSSTSLAKFRQTWSTYDAQELRRPPGRSNYLVSPKIMASPARLELDPVGASWPLQSLVVRTPNIGGAENGA